MTLRLNYRYLQSYLAFYYRHLPKIKTEDEDKESLDVDKVKLKLKPIVKENLQTI